MEYSSEGYYSTYQEKALELGERLSEIEGLVKELDLDLLDKEIQEERFVDDYEKLHPVEVGIVAARVGSEVKIADLLRERHRILEEIHALGAEDHESYNKLIDFKSRYLN